MKSKLLIWPLFPLFFLAACSSPRSHAVAKPMDLGIIEVSRDSLREFTLSEGRHLNLTVVALANDEVFVGAVILDKEERHVLARPSLKANYGQKISLSTDQGAIEMIIKHI
jgi:hypothetical protein